MVDSFSEVNTDTRMSNGSDRKQLDKVSSLFQALDTARRPVLTKVQPKYLITNGNTAKMTP